MNAYYETTLGYEEVDYLQETRAVAEKHRRSPYVQRARIWHTIIALNPMWWTLCVYTWRRSGDAPLWYFIISRALGCVCVLVFTLVSIYTALGTLVIQLVQFILGPLSEFIWRHTISTLIWNMAHHQNESVYTSLPLDSSGYEIRLLRIQPGHDSAPIHCDLLSSDVLSSNYEALSYAWGTGLPCHLIYLNGQPFRVTQTLRDALRNLRRPDAPRTFWIDAICINQDDLVEKSEQVQQMRRIYSNAQRVVIWLGHLPFEAKHADLLLARVPHLEDDVDGLRALGHIDHYAEETLKSLIRRAWWGRAWIVQEVVAAQEVDVLFGEYTLNWKDFCGLIEHIQDIDVAFVNVEKIPPSVTELILRVKQLRDGKHDSEWDLLNVVYAFRHQQASEAPDKLYAFRDIMKNPCAMKLLTDYSKPSAEVFRTFTKAYIEHYHDLRVLSLVTESQHHSPTWCPNFGAKPADWRNSQGIISDPFQGKFSASGDRRVFSILAHHDPLVLGLQGWVYDTVVAVGRCGPLAEETNFGPTLEAWKRLARLNDMRPIAGVVFNHTISAGQGFTVSSWSSNRPEEPPLSSVPRGAEHRKLAMSYVFDMCVNRRFFITAKGAYGIGPAQTRPGDRVCVLFGGNVPFVLRRSKSSHWLPRRIELKDESYVYHTMVGLAYVHGIMNYEGDINQDVAEKKLIVEDFYLR